MTETTFPETQEAEMKPDQKRSLAEELLRNAIGHFEANKAELERRVALGASFEDWLNARFMRACNRLGEMMAVTEAAYAGLTDDNWEGPISRERLDLFAVRLLDGVPAFVECAIVHRTTHDKWRAKIAWDAEKLRRIDRDDVLKMVVVYCCSVAQDVLTDPTWTEWIDGIEFGAVEKLPPLSFPIGNGGQFALMAWIVP
ncbi:hypothetical protein [Azospirillum argentinense]|nr:hypothetical protein [Azospirillum argentinense]